VGIAGKPLSWCQRIIMPSVSGRLEVSGSTGMDPELGSQNGIMIHGKKTDGTYLVEFRTDASAHADAPHLNARQQAQER
jgi:hypothetical protein